MSSSQINADGNNSSPTVERESVFLGVDIGGSHVGVGLVDTQGALLCCEEKSTQGATLTPTQTMHIVITHTLSMLRALDTQCVVSGAGIGCPGQTCAETGTLVAASNLPLFKDAPLVNMLRDALRDAGLVKKDQYSSLPVTLLNDADAAIAAEVWGSQGVYDGLQNVAMLTLGTGVGLGLILDGALFQGSHGLVEGGHMIVCTGESARPCGCGQRGCVEAYASARSTGVRLRERVGGERDFSGKEVFGRYARDDPDAVAIVEETAEKLAIACINLCRVVDPQVIVLGGGLANAGDALLDAVYRQLHAHTWTVLPSRVRLLLAQSSEGGVLGAALAAQRKFARYYRQRDTTVGAHCKSCNTDTNNNNNSNNNNNNNDSDKPCEEVNNNNNSSNCDESSNGSLARWLGAALTVSSAAALLLSTQRSLAQTQTHTQSQSLRSLRDLLLLGNLGMGVALLLAKNT